ncbi:hypothetical protein LZ009_09660 [Ramlibacter sp. XY19]|nr:hypothetical protein [Ramlibacter paludis]MCG2593046.1 hypothetical protein [Ramlibacter paludis]
MLQTEHTVEFLVKRVFRIYSLYVTAVLIHSIVLLLLGAPVPWGILLPQVLLIGDFFGTPYALARVE